VVALMDDVFFQMKLAETAKQLGVESEVATNGEAFLGLMASEAKLVIVDLNARSQPIGGDRKIAARRRRKSAWSAFSRTCKQSWRRKRRPRDATKFCRARVSRKNLAGVF